MTLVVDASVAIKWFFEEEQYVEARALLSEGMPIIAPSIVLAEMANAVWKRWRRGELAQEDVKRSMSLLAGPFTTLYPLEDLLGEAGRFAVTLNHPVYDCFYLALARREHAPLVTADRKLAALANRLDLRVQSFG